MLISLVDIFYPHGEEIRKILGVRSTGISPRDHAASRLFKGENEVILPEYKSLSYLKSIANGHVAVIGGATNQLGILAQYEAILKKMEDNPNEVYTLTLEDILTAIDEHPETPPIRWIYHTPVLEMLQTAKGTTLEKLLHIMGIKSIDDYINLRFMPDVNSIGFSQEYKEIGIGEPLWRVETTAIRVSSQQKPLALPAQEIPFIEGYDPFLMLAGANFLNPNYNMIVLVGGRGYSTFAAALLANGKDQVSSQELSDMDLIGTTYHVKGVNNFLEQVMEELRENLSFRYGKQFKGIYYNVAILGMTHIQGGLPISVSGPIDIRFYSPMK